MSNDYWNPNLYDQQHDFVSQFGEGILQLLAAQDGEHILDLGCGTGDIASTLSEKGVHVKGIDSSENMIQQAQNKYPHIPFHVEDATALTDKNQFDAVFSNATLHWVKQPEQALQAIYNSLKTNGRFVAEFGAKGNVAKITNEIKAQAGKLNLPYAEEKFPWYFPSIGEYTTLMEKAGFHVSFAQAFDRPTQLKGKDGLRNWINMFGQSMFPNLAEPTYLQLIQQIEANLQRSMYKNGHWIADYKRIRVIGIKQ